MTVRMKLLIGYDGSDCADHTLDDLRRAGLPREGEAIVLTVGEVWLPRPQQPQFARAEKSMAPIAAGAKEAPVVDHRTSEMLEEALALAVKAVSKVESYFTAWEVHAEAMAGSPAREILKRANEWGSDLIVVGCQGCSGLGKFSLGSVSQKVVTEAPCSVRITRGTAWKDGSPVRIVIGLDGSPASQAAVTAVASRSWPMGSEVRIVAVEDRLSWPGRVATPIHKGLETRLPEVGVWVEEFVETAARQLRNAELRVSSKIEVGDPKQILVTDAEEWGADCIFLGSYGSGNHLQSHLLGSVATAVVARAHCSVEILRTREVANAGRG